MKLRFKMTTLPTLLLQLQLMMLLQCGTGYDVKTAPRKYSIGERVDVGVYRVVSDRTMMAYDYYDPELGFFCRPDKAESVPMSPSSLVGSDRVSTAPYQIDFLRTVPCAVVGGGSAAGNCTQTLGPREVGQLAELVGLEYKVQVLVDRLPAVSLRVDPKTQKELRRGIGVPLGARGLDGLLYLYNHVTFRVHYQDYEDNTYFITQVEVEPLSVTSSTCRIGRPLVVGGPAAAPQMEPFSWTYSVHWVPEQHLVTPTAHSTRWKRFLPAAAATAAATAEAAKSASPDPCWFAGANVTICAISLTVIAFVFVSCTAPKYHKEADNNNNDNNNNGIVGYGHRPLKHRPLMSAAPLTTAALLLPPPPARPMLLAVLVGAGGQLLLAFALAMAAGLLGWVSVDDPYALLSAACIALAAAGAASGYLSARVYALFHGKHRTKCAFAAAVATPGAFHAAVFVLTAIAIGTPAINLHVLWRASGIVFLAVPLSALGSFAATPTTPTTATTVTTVTTTSPPPPPATTGARSSPQSCSSPTLPLLSLLSSPPPSSSSSLSSYSSEWYGSSKTSIVFSSFVPFLAGCVQLSVVVSAAWSYRVLKLSEMCAWLAGAVYVVCPLTSILVVSFTLLGKCPSWWWRSFLSCAASSLYLVAYFAAYRAYALPFADTLSSLLYVVYCLVAVAAYSVAAGAAGTLASYLYLSKLSTIRNISAFFD